MYKRIAMFLVMLIVVMNVVIAFAQDMDAKYWDKNAIIPAEYGKLIQVNSGSNSQILYFEANDGTIRLVEICVYDYTTYYVGKFRQIAIKRR